MSDFERDRACKRCGHLRTEHAPSRGGQRGECFAPADNAGGFCDCEAFVPEDVGP